MDVSKLKELEERLDVNLTAVVETRFGKGTTLAEVFAMAGRREELHMSSTAGQPLAQRSMGQPKEGTPIYVPTFSHAKPATSLYAKSTLAKESATARRHSFGQPKVGTSMCANSSSPKEGM